MSRFYSYINTADTLIESYKGEKPFAIFLKQFFAANKKYGAKDRRNIASLCYNFFRLGFAVPHKEIKEKILMATFLCDREPSELLQRFKPEWNDQIKLSIDKKLNLLKDQIDPGEIFPFISELSPSVETDQFLNSFLVQPNLFIRIRPQNRLTALKKLEKSKLPYQLIEEDCVQLPNSARVEDFFIIDKEVVIQDFNSQKVLDYLKSKPVSWELQNSKSKAGFTVWDCCAASGGKSILLYDILKHKFDLTVSDKRASIISNLHQRFKTAGIKEYKYFIEDIGSNYFKGMELDFDMIVCDAPCTGSGTWSRTPEQLCFFKPATIKQFSSLQRKIVSNVFPNLKSGGIFIYITCSVFKEENENVAEFITQQFKCKLLHQQLLKGYDKKADNMFVAVFSK